MSPLRFVRRFSALLAASLMVVAAGAHADDGCCSPSGSCCPKTTFFRTKPPHIHWKRICPKPICDPCSLEHYGYYPTCWHPWPFPPDYSHCQHPQPGMTVDAVQAQPPVMPRANGEDLPTPHKATLPDRLPGT
jgi:hypothetical protein